MDDMTKHGSTAYDRISYPGHPFGETHPDHLGTLGALFGMSLDAATARISFPSPFNGRKANSSDWT